MLPMIPQDKANHAVYGTVIYGIVKIVTQNKDWALIAVCAAAVLKEIYDKVSKKGDPEILDALATVMPALLIYMGD